MTSNNMSKKEIKVELLKNIRLELFQKKKIIPAKTFTTLSGKLYALEFGGKNNMKSIENFYKKEIQPLSKEINTKEKLIKKNKQVKEATNEFFDAVEYSGLINATSKKSKEQRKQARDAKYQDLNMTDNVRDRDSKLKDRYALGGKFKETFITEGLNDGIDNLTNRLINDK